MEHERIKLRCSVRRRDFRRGVLEAFWLKLNQRRWFTTMQHAAFRITMRCLPTSQQRSSARPPSCSLSSNDRAIQVDECRCLSMHWRNRLQAAKRFSVLLRWVRNSFVSNYTMFGISNTSVGNSHSQDEAPPQAVTTNRITSLQFLSKHVGFMVWRTRIPRCHFTRYRV